MFRSLQNSLLRNTGTLACLVVLVAAGAASLCAEPITTKEGVLPPGTELNEDALDRPTELFESELAGGRRSYLLNLGDMLFSSPAILGGVARQAGMSCATCHQQGGGNARLFVPGMSSRAGNFDTTGPLFNPKADNGVFDPVRAPSLRGAKYLAPYGHDGRFASLRDFVRNVIVNEFAGGEPSQQVLDGLVAYIHEIAFLPNAKLSPDGRLTGKASVAARRGEILFERPFPQDASMSCATCHVPSGAFVDHRTHDVGTGGLQKTPTLLNANLNAPYFHDARYGNYAEAVAYFDRHFRLGLSERDRADLVAYLDAVGGADEPYTRNAVQAGLDELRDFSSVLDRAIPERNLEVIALAADTVGGEWRELGEKFPGRADTTVKGGMAERERARAAVRGVVLAIRRISMAAEKRDFAMAAEAYDSYRREASAAADDLKKAEPWSLYNPKIWEAHFEAVKQLADIAREKSGRK